MSDEFIIRQGDTGPAITATLRNEDGSRVDLQDVATVTFTMIPVGGGTSPVTNETAGFEQDNGDPDTFGDVSYEWASGDTADDGLYLGAWVVTYDSGDVVTYPNGGYVLVRVTPRDMFVGTNYITIEQLKKTRSLQGTTYAQDDLEIAIAAASRGIDLVCGRHFYRDQDPGDDPVARHFTPIGDDLCLIDDLIADDDIAIALGYGTTYQDFAANRFKLAPFNAPADGKPYTRIEAMSYYGCGPFRPSPASVRVTGRWGWPTIPDPIKQATGILASQLALRHREAIFGVILAGSEIGAIARIARNDPQVMFLIHGFERKVVA